MMWRGIQSSLMARPLIRLLRVIASALTVAILEVSGTGEVERFLTVQVVDTLIVVVAVLGEGHFGIHIQAAHRIHYVDKAREIDSHIIVNIHAVEQLHGLHGDIDTMSACVCQLVLRTLGDGKRHVEITRRVNEAKIGPLGLGGSASVLWKPLDEYVADQGGKLCDGLEAWLRQCGS